MMRFVDPSTELPADTRHLVLYDGDCGLCDRTVQRLLRADRHGVLAYAPLQGPTAAAVRARHAAVPALDSILLLADAGMPGERLLARSDAALELARIVGGGWRLLGIARALPRPWRDAAYDFVARRRHRWFGRPEVCSVPPPATRRRFLP